MNLKKDRTRVGDFVIWNVAKGHAYFDDSLQRFGILIKKIEQFDYWIYADVLDEQGKLDRVMLYKQDNPL